jgi:hypothetical protein
MINFDEISIHVQNEELLLIFNLGPFLAIYINLMLKNLARVAFNLTKALPLPKTSIYFKLQTRALYSFSTFDPKNIQKIMVGISVKDTEGILKDLESLDAKSKEFALMMIIESIERKEIPYQLLSE